ncbi:MAG: hypothetical protein AABY76_05430 [Planctomycetota bacterium]
MMFRNKPTFIKTFSALLLAASVAMSHLSQACVGSPVLCVIQGNVTAKKPKYLQNTIVYVESVPNTVEPPKEHVVMDQKNMTFVPHVLPVIKGTTVDFLNSDMVQHNIYSPDAVADNVNLGTWLQGEFRPFTFNKLGVATLRCNVHVDMEAYILILQNPCFTKVNNDGSFSISNVPEGAYIVKLWNERYKAEDQKATVSANHPASVAFCLK